MCPNHLSSIVYIKLPVMENILLWSNSGWEFGARGRSRRKELPRSLTLASSIYLCYVLVTASESYGFVLLVFILLSEQPPCHPSQYRAASDRSDHRPSNPGPTASLLGRRLSGNGYRGGSRGSGKGWTRTRRCL